MNILLILISIIFSIFSTTVMCYVSMATPIGPWIAPTLVLLGSLIFRLFKGNIYSELAYAVSAGSIGGIMATALGFSLPTIFFLDKVFFAQLLDSPLKFAFIISGLSLISATTAFLFCNKFEETFLRDKTLMFPIGEMIYRAINAQKNLYQSIQLLIGSICTILFCILQDGFFVIKNIIPRTITIINSQQIFIFDLPTLKFDLFPLYWAIGYVSGTVIALPLLAGALLKIFVSDPINTHLFNYLSSTDFMLAFASGLVLYSAIIGFVATLPSLKIYFDKALIKGSISYNLNKTNYKYWLTVLVPLVLSIIYARYLNFGYGVQLYAVIFTLICTYQVVAIAGKIGLAQLGRFATFVMIPAMLLFNISFFQLTIIATFVELTAGIATDMMFSRKLAQLANLPFNILKRYQILGLVVSALFSGFIFILFVKTLGLGTEELFAQRAQARALLVNFTGFDMQVMLIGFGFGCILKVLKLNPMFVLGGLLMPFNITISLLTGAMIEKLCSKKIDLQPFWSGVFATQSIWIFLRALMFKLFT